MRTNIRLAGITRRTGSAIKLAAALAAAGVTLAACGTSSGYPVSAQASFLDGCESNATNAQCGCMLSYVEGHMSFSTFSADAGSIADEIDSGNYPVWLTNAAQTCA